jgi:hypothetical protein
MHDAENSASQIDFPNIKFIVVSSLVPKVYLHANDTAALIVISKKHEDLD